MPEETQPVILLPSYLAEAIEWVLRSKKAAAPSSAPDLSRLTSEQLQLLPLQVAQAFMDLSLAALQEPVRRSRSDYGTTSPAREFSVDPRAKQRARRTRERANALAAAHQRLYAWYARTGSARQRGFVS